MNENVIHLNTVGTRDSMRQKMQQESMFLDSLPYGDFVHETFYSPIEVDLANGATVHTHGFHAKTIVGKSGYPERAVWLEATSFDAEGAVKEHGYLLFDAEQQQGLQLRRGNLKEFKDSYEHVFKGPKVPRPNARRLTFAEHPHALAKKGKKQPGYAFEIAPAKRWKRKHFVPSANPAPLYFSAFPDISEQYSTSTLTKPVNIFFGDNTRFRITSVMGKMFWDRNGAIKPFFLLGGDIFDGENRIISEHGCLDMETTIENSAFCDYDGKLLCSAICDVIGNENRIMYEIATAKEEKRKLLEETAKRVQAAEQKTIETTEYYKGELARAESAAIASIQYAQSEARRQLKAKDVEIRKLEHDNYNNIISYQRQQLETAEKNRLALENKYTSAVMAPATSKPPVEKSFWGKTCDFLIDTAKKAAPIVLALVLGKEIGGPPKPPGFI